MWSEFPGNKRLEKNLFPGNARMLQRKTTFFNCESVVFYIYYLGLQEEGAKDIKRRLKSARQYLKTHYNVHLSRESSCPDHCRQFALSSSEPEFHESCTHQHSVGCRIDVRILRMP